MPQIERLVELFLSNNKEVKYYLIDVRNVTLVVDFSKNNLVLQTRIEQLAGMLATYEGSVCVVEYQDKLGEVYYNKSGNLLRNYGGVVPSMDGVEENARRKKG